MRKILSLLILAIVATAAHAVTIASGTNVKDTNGTLLASGQWCLGASCLPVTNGAFSGSVTSATATVTVVNASSTTVLSVSSVVVSGSTFSWDNYTLAAAQTYTGYGVPYIACQLAATYTQIDSNPANTVWNCVAQSGQLVWTRSGSPTPIGPGIVSGVGAPTGIQGVVPTVYFRTDSPQQWNLYGVPGSTSTTWIQQTTGSTGCLSGNSLANGCTSATSAAAAAVAIVNGNPIAPSLVTSSGGVDVQTSSLQEELANNTASGATLNLLVCGANVGGVLKAQTCTTSSLSWTGVAIGGALNTSAGNTILARAGAAGLVMDGASTIGDYVQVSTTNAGYGHDIGTSLPTSGSIIGKVVVPTASSGQIATVNLYSPGTYGWQVALGATSTGSGSSSVATFPGEIVALTYNAQSALVIPLVNVNTVQNLVQTTETISGSSPAGDVSNLLGICTQIGSGTSASDAHCVGIKGENDFYGTGTVPKNIGLEGTVSNQSTGTLALGISVQGIFAGNTGGGSMTEADNFQSASTTQTLTGVGMYVDYRAVGLNGSSLCNPANSGAINCFAFYSDGSYQNFEMKGKMMLANTGLTTPDVQFHVFGGSSGQSLSALNGGGSSFENGGSNPNNLNVLMATGGGCISFSNAARMGIGECVGASYPLQVAANGEAQSLGDGSTTVYTGLAGNRGFLGFDGTNANTMVQGGAGKGIEFNCNNGAAANGGCAIVDVNGTFGVGNSQTVATNDPFFVTNGGVVTSNTLYASAKIGIGTTSPATNLDIENGSSGQTQPTMSGFLLNTDGSSNTTDAMAILTATGCALTVTNAARVGINECSAPLYPLHVGPNGEAASFGDSTTSAYLGFTGSRGFTGYDGTNANMAIQAISGKGVEVNVNNNTFGSGTSALFDSAGNFGVGTSVTAAASDNIYFTPAGLVFLTGIAQKAASNTGGTCAMVAAASCTQTIAHTYTTPVCIVTQQSATLTGGAVGCTVSGTTVTVTSATSNSETWGFLVFGNPS